MKKLLSVLFSIVLIFMLVACSEKNQGENKEVETQTQNIEIKEKTPKDKLADFIVENGVYDEEDGIYSIVEKMDMDSADDHSSYFFLRCDKNKEIELSYYLESKSPYDLSIDPDDYEENISVFTIELKNNTPAIPVSYLNSDKTPYVNSFLTGNTLFIEATGEIYPEQISIENSKIYNIDFSYDSSISISNSKIKSQVDSLFPSGISATLAALNLFLATRTDISIGDLGFVNW